MTGRRPLLPLDLGPRVRASDDELVVLWASLILLILVGAGRRLAAAALLGYPTRVERRASPGPVIRAPKPKLGDPRCPSSSA